VRFVCVCVHVVCVCVHFMYFFRFGVGTFMKIMWFGTG
jgi:hypothetical protein